MLAPRAERAGITLEVAEAPELPPLIADERRVKQILINLATNAIKFTPPGGVVRLVADLSAEGGIDLSVSDTGIGIAPEHLSRVMEPFQQVGDRLTGSQEGTGLGLPLTKRLVEMHGGSLLIESTPGTGTRVVARFPAARTGTAASATAAAAE
jgi:signal transduction histidine kinase